MSYRTMAEVRAANAAAGQYWFDPATMRFFRSRVGTLYGDRYFVSSEQFDYGYPRLFTVREVQADASIETVGEFQGFETRKAAVAEIRRLLASSKVDA